MLKQVLQNIELQMTKSVHPFCASFSNSMESAKTMEDTFESSFQSIGGEKQNISGSFDDIDYNPEYTTLEIPTKKA